MRYDRYKLDTRCCSYPSENQSVDLFESIQIRIHQRIFESIRHESVRGHEARIHQWASFRIHQYLNDQSSLSFESIRSYPSVDRTSYRWTSYPSIEFASYRSEWPGLHIDELRVDQPSARETYSNPSAWLLVRIHQ